MACSLIGLREATKEAMIPPVGEEKFKISKDRRTLWRGAVQPSFQGLRNPLIEMKAENPVLLSGFSAARG